MSNEQQRTTESPKPYIDCPFCGEHDFDLYGLKIHLLRWCDVFDETEEKKK